MSPDIYKRIRIRPHIEIVAGIDGKWIRIGTLPEDLIEGNVEWEMKDEGDKYVIYVELPGTSKNDIELYASIKAIRLKAKPRRKLPWRPDVYRLTVRFKEEIDPDTTKAKYVDGLLTITAPKKQGVKKIKVE